MRKENIKRREESDEEKTEKKKVRTQGFLCVGGCMCLKARVKKNMRDKDKEIENRLLVMAVSYSRIHRRNKRCAEMAISL